MKLIINADDFGYDHNVNSAIIDAFSFGWISNTTVMTNMPGFPEAVSLAKEHKLMDKVGLHLNFLEGTPLSRELREDPVFCNADGIMTKEHVLKNLSLRRKFFLPRRTVAALRKEAEAQIHAYMAAGFTQMHADSHCHSHTIDAVYRAILPVLLKFNIRSLRKTLNFYGMPRSALIRIYKARFNRKVDKHFLSTDYFSSAGEYISGNQALLCDKDVCELMVHPIYEDGRIINKGNREFSDIAEYAKKFQLISFSELKKG